jgi:hypothetical protein
MKVVAGMTSNQSLGSVLRSGHSGLREFGGGLERRQPSSRPSSIDFLQCVATLDAVAISRKEKWSQE